VNFLSFRDNKKIKAKFDVRNCSLFYDLISILTNVRNGLIFLVSNSFDCVLIGDVFTDIIIKMNKNNEQICRGGTIYGKFAKPVLGGIGNIAVGLQTLGCKTAVVGKAGDDFLGRFYLQDLKANGVTTKIFLDGDFPTGIILVYLELGTERSFHVFRGANDKLSTAEIDKSTNLIKQSDYVYFSGFSLVNDPQRSAVLRAIDLARKFNKKIVFDPGAFNLIKKEKAFFSKLSNICDVFSPNLEEARAITNLNCLDDVIERLRETLPLTALKLDQNGCVLITKDKVIKVPSHNSECIDSTGAGDAFTAGVIYGLIQGLPLESTGQLANWFASQVVSKMGPRSFPTKTIINNFLKKLQ
jgi:sugar/nucleoside kinase (ribokinase family)